MKIFYGFKNTLVEPLEYGGFIDHSIKKLSCDTTVEDNMDYLKLNLIIPTNVL